MDVSIAIVGSGFSGLGLAIRLREEGVEDFPSSSAATASAERGTSTRIRAAPATCPRTCTRSRSRRTRTGRGPTRASPRSAPTSSAWPRLGSCRTIRLSSEVSRRALGRARALGDRHLAGRGARAGARLRHRAAGGAEDPGRSPAWREFAGPAFHSARWDHSVDLRGKRVAASAPARRRSSTSRRSRPTSSSSTSSSARRRGSCRTARGRSRRRAAAFRARPVRPARGARRDLRRARAARARLRQAAARDEAARARWRHRHRERSLKDPALIEQDDARTTRSAASASCPRTSGIRRSRARTSSSSPTRIARGPRALGGARVRPRDRGRRARVRHRLPRDRHAGRPRWSAAATAARSRTSGTARRDAHLGCTPCRASRTCSSCSARTPASGTARWST